MYEENIDANYQVYRIAKELYACHKERIELADQLNANSPLFISGLISNLDQRQQQKIGGVLEVLVNELEAITAKLAKNSHTMTHQYQILRDITNPLFIEIKE